MALVNEVLRLALRARSDMLFSAQPDHADEAPALEAEARLFTRYLVGRPPPAELVDRYRAANAEVLAIDGGTP